MCAVQVKTAAKGDARNTGMPRTPAPDSISQIKNPTGVGYGQNNAGLLNPSSVEPGRRVLSPLAQNLEQSGTDETLQTILSRPRGALNKGADDQTRVIDDKGYPAAHGMKPRASDGTIPDKIGATSAPPVRTPTK